MFAYRDPKIGGQPEYLVCWPGLTDIGDRSILIDNLRAISAGEADRDPTIYYSAAGSDEFQQVECKTSSIDGKPGRRRTIVRLLNGDEVDEVHWWLKYAENPKKVGKRKKKKHRKTFYLLAEVFPLPEGERRFTPIGVYKRLGKAQRWAEELTKQYEYAASLPDITDQLVYRWQTDKASGELSLRTYDGGGEVGHVQFVITTISTNPPPRDTYREVSAGAEDLARSEGDFHSADLIRDARDIEDA